mgnify:CR=1 FL=1
MELHDCIDALKKHIWLIAVLAVLSAAAACMISQYALDKEYESSATMVVTGKSIETTNGIACEYSIILDKNTIKVIDDIAQSDAVLKKVIRDLDLSCTVEEMRRILEIDFDAETGVIKVSAVTNTPAMSRDIVHKYIGSLGYHTKNFIRAKLYVIDPAKLPIQPSGPNTPLSVALAAAMAVMAGILAAILLTVKERAKLSIFALEKLPELFHIGSVPAIRNFKNQKGRPVFSNSSAAYESLKTIRTNLLYLLEKNSANTVMVTSPREYEGKTVLAINIAVSFAQFDQKVLLIDCNFKNPAIYNLIHVPGEIPEGESAQGQNSNVFVAKPVENLGIDVVFDIMIPQDHPNVDFTLFASMIETLKASYDLIVLDCPPILTSADTKMISYIAKNAAIVADYRHLSHWVIKKSINNLTQIDSKILGIILNRVPKRKIM